MPKYSAEFAWSEIFGEACGIFSVDGVEKRLEVFISELP
jgi:hypothetical protein